MYKLKKRSEAGRLVLNDDPFADRYSKETNLQYWNGVVVGIDIDLNNAARFADILNVVQDFYFEKTKYKHLKKPKFI